MPSTRLLAAAVCMLLLSASPSTVCRRFTCARPSGPAPTGPTLDMVPPDLGLLTLWYPNRDARAFVYVDAIGDLPPYTTPEEFPIRIPIQLGKRYVVRANVDDDASFASEPFTLTPDHREQEIVIHLTEHRVSFDYGFAKSELPTETGFVPLAAPADGVPAPPVFMERRGGGGGWEPPYIHYRSSFLVDERGDVWFDEIRWAARENKSVPEPTYRQLGHLDPAVFQRMKDLRDDATRGQLEPPLGCAACIDCGDVHLAVFGGIVSGTQGVVIANGASECKLSTAPAAKSIAAWMVALRTQAQERK